MHLYSFCAPDPTDPPPVYDSTSNPKVVKLSWSVTPPGECQYIEVAKKSCMYIVMTYKI